MKKFINFLKKHSKKIALLSVIPAVAIGTGIAVSWGPERPTFTIQKPANYVTFNSITDNPNYGDERSFVDARDGNVTGYGGFANVNEVKHGQTMTIRAYVHNNASANLNLVSENTRVRFQIPTGQSKNMRINGFIDSDNARPKQVWDNTDFYGANPFSFEYVPGSARIQTNKMDTKLPDSIVGANGTQIGYDKLDGRVPGCFEYDALVTIKVKVNMPQPNFEMSKEVAKAGGQWQNDVTVDPGETVNYRIQFKNTGGTELQNVIVKDTLPQHVSYVPGTSKLYNASNPGGLAISDNVTTTGVNIGRYAPGANAIVTFQAKIGEESTELCKAGKLRNVASVTPGGQNPKEDDANVTPECEEPETPVYACDALEADRLSIKLGEKANFTARGSASNGATITGYIFKVNGQVVQDSSSNTYAYTGTAEGTYDVSVIVKTDKGNTAENNNCKKQVKVTEEAPEPVYECVNLAITPAGGQKFSFTTTTRQENATVNKYIYNFGDGSAELNTTNQTVEYEYAKPGNYVATVRVVFDVNGTQQTANGRDCQGSITIAENPCPSNPSLPKDDPNCKPCPHNPTLPFDSPDCKEKPGVPPVTVLPATGAGGILAGLFGASASAYGAVALVEKRRALKK